MRQKPYAPGPQSQAAPHGPAPDAQRPGGDVDQAPTAPVRRPGVQTPQGHAPATPAAPPQHPAYSRGPYGPMPYRPVPGMPPPMPRPPSGGRTFLSVLWSLVPLGTLGLLTPVSFLYAALKLRTQTAWAALALYLVGTVTMVASGPSGALGEALFVASMLLNTLGGTAHSFAVRRRVFPRPDPVAYGNDQAIQFAQHRRELRQEARERAEQDPGLALELRIGRPDLPRRYDDGGLVDMNHAPAAVIATLPGMTPDLVKQILEARQTVGTFSSALEVCVTADLPADLTSTLTEYTVYLP
ncbi:helix-hairpin-helix domain-containing protein [Microtetraspora malaysiensis]|uniref:helix-hairpin-helix domain-containing protein n=1 Tax=Microtetraspora malaysiensis TaxID=161358 RepID=UPI003D93DE2C